MGTLYLVRHGQASFGEADYDRLSSLGQRQCVRLGEYFRRRGRRFDAVITGTLARHAQSWDAIARGLGEASPAGQPLRLRTLDEYDSAALIAAVHPLPRARPGSADEVRQHFRLLKQGLAAWMEGRSAPAGMPSYAEFAAGIRAALDDVRARDAGEVLIVSSGGPIATAVAQVLGAPPAAAIELNMRLRNSALTEFAFTPRRHALVSFNTLPHLDDPACDDLVTLV